MAAPSVLQFGGGAKTNSVVCGALSTSFAIMAIWEITRALRWINLSIGGWLVIAPWVFGFQGMEIIVSTIVGLIMMAMSLIRGTIKNRTGGGWTSLLGRGADQRGS